MVDERYLRNIGTITPEENALLANKRVCVVGCGGLGGYVIESLGRIGVGFITAVDFDAFEISNLNRQLTSEEALIGMNKAFAAKQRMERVNPLVLVTASEVKLKEENAGEIIAGHDVVVDALDSLEPRRILQRECERQKVPLVHGAIGGWYGQVTIVMPGDRTLDKLYNPDTTGGVEKTMGTPGFTPAIVGSVQACETVKLLIGRGMILQNKVLNIDLLNEEFVIYDLR